MKLYGVKPWTLDHLHPIYGLVFRLSRNKDKIVLQKKAINGLEDGGRFNEALVHEPFKRRCL